MEFHSGTHHRPVFRPWLDGVFGFFERDFAVVPLSDVAQRIVESVFGMEGPDHLARTARRLRELYIIHDLK